MSYVLLMAALEFSDPVSAFIHVKIDNLSWNSRLQLRREPVIAHLSLAFCALAVEHIQLLGHRAP
jgi:hypothetical protein